MGFKATCHSLRATAELPPSKLSPPPSLSDADRASANFSASLPPPSPAANRSCCCRRCSSPSPSCPPAFPARRRGFFASATLVRTGQEAGGGGATGAGRGAAGAAGAEVRNDAAMRFRAPTGNPSARRASSSSSFSACRGRSRHSCAIVSYLFREPYMVDDVRCANFGESVWEQRMGAREEMERQMAQKRPRWASQLAVSCPQHCKIVNARNCQTRSPGLWLYPPARATWRASQYRTAQATSPPRSSPPPPAPSSCPQHPSPAPPS